MCISNKLPLLLLVQRLHFERRLRREPSWICSAAQPPSSCTTSHTRLNLSVPQLPHGPHAQNNKTASQTCMRVCEMLHVICLEPEPALQEMES